MYGFAKLYKAIQAKTWYKNDHALRVYVHIILNADYTICPNELRCSMTSLGEAVGLSRQQVRDAVKALHPEILYIGVKGRGGSENSKFVVNTVEFVGNVENSSEIGVNASERTNKRTNKNGFQQPIKKSADSTQNSDVSCVENFEKNQKNNISTTKKETNKTHSTTKKNIPDSTQNSQIREPVGEKPTNYKKYNKYYTTSFPTLAAVQQAAEEFGVDQETAAEFYAHYELCGWKTRAGKPLTNWIPQLLRWRIDWYE